MYQNHLSLTAVEQDPRTDQCASTPEHPAYHQENPRVKVIFQNSLPERSEHNQK